MSFALLGRTSACPFIAVDLFVFCLALFTTTHHRLDVRTGSEDVINFSASFPIILSFISSGFKPVLVRCVKINSS